MISLAIADSHEIYRNGLSQILNLEDNLEVCIETNSFNKLFKKIGKNPVCVALITANISSYGLATSVSILKREFPDLKIVVLGGQYNPSVMVSLFQSGINSYLLRTSSKKDIISAVQTLNCKKYFFQRGTPTIVKNSVLKNKYNLIQDFNDREIEIIQLICDDKSNKEIADKVCLSIRTIEWYRRAILAKMNVKSPVGIFKYAVQNHIYQL